MCKNRQGNDKYVEREMQTINSASKSKEVQSDHITMVEKSKQILIYFCLTMHKFGDPGVFQCIDCSFLFVLFFHNQDPTDLIIL